MRVEFIKSGMYNRYINQTAIYPEGYYAEQQGLGKYKDVFNVSRLQFYELCESIAGMSCGAFCVLEKNSKK